MGSSYSSTILKIRVKIETIQLLGDLKHLAAYKHVSALLKGLPSQLTSTFLIGFTPFKSVSIPLGTNLNSNHQPYFPSSVLVTYRAQYQTDSKLETGLTVPCVPAISMV